MKTHPLMSQSEFEIKVPVDPTDQVMLRLKLLEALMDMSKFLLAFSQKRKKKDKHCINRLEGIVGNL